RDGRLHRIPAHQPPDQDGRGHAQRGPDRGGEPGEGVDRDEHQHRQGRIDQATEATELFEQRLLAGYLGLGLITGGRGLRRGGGGEFGGRRVVLVARWHTSVVPAQFVV